MNNSKFIIKTYLKNLSLNKLNKNQLKKLKNVKTFQSIHEIIGNDEYCSTRNDDAPLKSISSRINGIWSDSLKNNIPFEKDSLNRTILKATPKLNRSILMSENWITNPFKNIWKSFCKKKLQKNSKKETKKLTKKKYYKISIRRFILLIVTLLQTIIATWYMKTILPYQKISLINNTQNFNQNWKENILLNIPYTLEICILFLFSILFCWLSASFWTALMGFIQLIGNNKNNISYSLKKKININPQHYTAIIMPICNEDVDLAFAGLKATWESLTKTGNNKYFDIYILSDSYNADIIISEQKSWMDLVHDLNGYGKIFYRRRKRCVKSKSGNIDDFCRRWGNNYQYMIILDADSVMSGECLTNLVNMMEINPKAGIIQSYPKAYGMNTFYARCQQFSMRIYGPIFTAGLHFWQLGESHYWGHNAIIRLKPFIKYCSLAPLPGKGIFSGSILSHDFVEAALMRRAGWNVWIAYDLPGSYEELPPNLLDELKRDRRWCYGNLMNFRLFLVKGIHPVHRTVFLTGVMSYISSPLWFVFLILSTVLQLSQKFIETSYTLKSNQVLLKLTEWKPELTVILFSTTLFLLFLPKLLSIILICFKGVKPYGGIKKLFISIILEMIFSILLAPIRMLFHTIFILKAFIGYKILWHSPQRNNKSTNWNYAFKKHSSQVILGLIWLILIIFLDVKFLLYLSPVIFSWILSPFISVLSSRTVIGLKSKQLKLFMTPEEYDPPKELIDAKNYLRINRKTSLRNGFMHALFNPTINALATGLATSRHKNNKLIEFERERKINELLNNSPQSIKYKQKLEIINDPVILARIHSNLWSNLNQYNKWISLYKKIILNSKIFFKKNKILN